MADAEDEEAPYVRLRVSPEQKRRWREYAEEHHYGTISGLIREAVENTIDDEWVLQGDSSVSVDHSELGIDEIKDEMETLNVKIDDLITHGMGRKTTSCPTTSSWSYLRSVRAGFRWSVTKSISGRFGI